MRWISLSFCALAAGVRAAAPDPVSSLPTVVFADSEGVLDVASALRERTQDAIPNPFRIRHQPQKQAREVPLAIGSVLVADRPENSSAIINGRLCSPGDMIEGMKLVKIGGDVLELGGDNLILRIPVQDAPPRLRLDR